MSIYILSSETSGNIFIRGIVCFQADLADSQGGNGAGDSEHAPNIFERLSLMGAETISSRGLSELTASINTLNASLGSMKRDIESLKRGETGSGEIPAKRVRLEGDDDHSDNNESLIDAFLHPEPCEAPHGEDDGFEISQFFEEETETGDAINNELAMLTNTSLRSKAKKDKIKVMEDKHKRPNNVENLQVLKVEDVLWRQLRGQTKSSDYAIQRLQKNICLSLIPTLKLMQHLKQGGDSLTTKELVGDIYKVLVHTYVESNEARREKIRQELLPKYRKVCDEPASVTKLFGDKLEENIKKMKETSTSLTPVTNKKPFLSKRGGGMVNQNNNKRKPQYSAQTYPPPVQRNKFPRSQQKQFHQKKNRTGRK